MEEFKGYLETIENEENREKMKALLSWIANRYPQLKREIKWSQPMFTDHGTFILGLSVAKKHIAVSPENVTISHLEEEIIKSQYDYTKGMIRIPWQDEINYGLLEQMIDFNIWDKRDCKTFWR